MAQRVLALLALLRPVAGPSMYGDWLQLELGTTVTVTASSTELSVSSTLLPITTTGASGVDLVRATPQPSSV